MLACAEATPNPAAIAVEPIPKSLPFARPTFRVPLDALFAPAAPFVVPPVAMPVTVSVPVEALLQPNKTVGKWLGWWRAARPLLTRMSQQVLYTEGVPMAMGMTCGVGSAS